MNLHASLHFQRDVGMNYIAGVVGTCWPIHPEGDVDTAAFEKTEDYRMSPLV